MRTARRTVAQPTARRAGKAGDRGPARMEFDHATGCARPSERSVSLILSQTQWREVGDPSAKAGCGLIFQTRRHAESASASPDISKASAAKGDPEPSLRCAEAGPALCTSVCSPAWLHAQASPAARVGWTGRVPRRAQIAMRAGAGGAWQARAPRRGRARNIATHLIASQSDEPQYCDAQSEPIPSKIPFAPSQWRGKERRGGGQTEAVSFFGRRPSDAKNGREGRTVGRRTRRREGRTVGRRTRRREGRAFGRGEGKGRRKRSAYLK